MRICASKSAQLRLDFRCLRNENVELWKGRKKWEFIPFSGSIERIDLMVLEVKRKAKIK